MKVLLGDESRKNDAEALIKKITSELVRNSFLIRDFEDHDSNPYQSFVASQCAESLRDKVQLEDRFCLVAIHCALAFSEALSAVEPIHALLEQPNVTVAHENVFLGYSGRMVRTRMSGGGSLLTHWGYQETQRYRHGIADYYLPSEVDLDTEKRFVLTGGYGSKCLHAAFSNLISKMEERDSPFEIHIPFGGPVFHDFLGDDGIELTKDVIEPYLNRMSRLGDEPTVEYHDDHIIIERSSLEYGTQRVFFWKTPEVFTEYARCPEKLKNTYDDTSAQITHHDRIRWQDGGRRFEVSRIHEETSWIEISEQGAHTQMKEVDIVAFKASIQKEIEREQASTWAAGIERTWESISAPAWTWPF